MSECPPIIHHNWFGPLFCPHDKKVFELNLQRVANMGSAWRVIVWTSARYCEPGAFEGNTSYVRALQCKYQVEIRCIEDDDIVSRADLEMLDQLWTDTQTIRRLRAEDIAYAGRVTWIAAMSDFTRMAALHKYGGIWADIGDTQFPENFPALWVKAEMHLLPFHFRVAFNHSGIKRSPSQHLFAASAGSDVLFMCLERMRGLWQSRISFIDVTEQSFDAISTTLAWTGMGGTTGPIMKRMTVCVNGEDMNMMEAWSLGWKYLRMGLAEAGTDFCVLGKEEEDFVRTWSNKSWIKY